MMMGMSQHWHVMVGAIFNLLSIAGPTIRYAKPVSKTANAGTAALGSTRFRVNEPSIPVTAPGIRELRLLTALASNLIAPNEGEAIVGIGQLLGT